jgi:hypothetical protein
MSAASAAAQEASDRGHELIGLLGALGLGGAHDAVGSVVVEEARATLSRAAWMAVIWGAAIFVALFALTRRGGEHHHHGCEHHG